MINPQLVNLGFNTIGIKVAGAGDSESATRIQEDTPLSTIWSLTHRQPFNMAHIPDLKAISSPWVQVEDTIFRSAYSGVQASTIQEDQSIPFHHWEIMTIIVQTRAQM